MNSHTSELAFESSPVRRRSIGRARHPLISLALVAATTSMTTLAASAPAAAATADETCIVDFNTEGYPTISTTADAATGTQLQSNPTYPQPLTFLDGAMRFQTSLTGTATWANGVQAMTDAITGEVLYLQPQNAPNYQTTNNYVTYTMTFPEPVSSLTLNIAGLNNNDGVTLLPSYQGVLVPTTAANFLNATTGIVLSDSATRSPNVGIDTAIGTSTSGGTSVTENFITYQVNGPIDMLVVYSGKNTNLSSQVTIALHTFSLCFYPDVAAAKSIASAPVANGDGTYSVTYSVTASNTRDADVPHRNLYDVQLVDDLGDFGTYTAGTLSMGHYTVSDPVIVDNTPAEPASGTQLAANTGFDGASDPTLLDGSSGWLPFGESVTVQYTVTFFPTPTLTAQTFSNSTTASGDISTYQDGVPDGNTTDTAGPVEFTLTFPPGSISGTVELEPGVPIEGAVVTLSYVDDSGTPVTTTVTTGADGTYSFSSLLPHEYTVTVTNVSLDQTVDPDAILDGATTIDLALGQVVADVDFTYEITYTLGDLIFSDVNRDGVYDAAIDAVVPDGTTVVLRDATGTSIGTTATSGGVYSFGGLTPGGYAIALDTAQFGPGQPLEGWVVTVNPVADPDGDVDDDNNGALNAGTIESGLVTLSGSYTIDGSGNVVPAGNEPSSADGTVNSTLDIGLFAPVLPAVVVEKSTNGQDADSAPGPYVTAGTAVTWTYTVTNTGNTYLANIVVADSDSALVVTCAATTVAPDASTTCTATGTATAGQYANTGTVTADPALPNGTPIPLADPVSDTDDSHYVGIEPSVDIEKSVQTFDADVAPGPTVNVGDTVLFSYVVTNTGDVGLSGIVVTDDEIGAITCPVTTLAPGVSTTCTATAIATAGQYDNVGTVAATAPATYDATGTLVSGATVGDTDMGHYFGAEPAVEIAKTVQGLDADDAASGPLVAEGGTVVFEYTVTNTGNSVLENIVVTDDIEGAIGCPSTTLAVGESMTCTLAGVDAIASGDYVNEGTVDATGPTPVTSAGADGTAAPVSDTDLAHYTVSSPAIDVEKFVQALDTDGTTDPAPVAVGDTVLFEYVVTNTGNVPLTGLTLVDDPEGTIDCGQTTLAVGEQITCTLTATATAGAYSNIAAASGVGPDTVGEPDPDTGAPSISAGATASDADTASYFGVAPAVSIEKSTQTIDADTAGLAPLVVAGGAVTWRYSVTNDGNVPLTDVVVTDDVIAAADIDCGAGDNVIAVLEVGQTVECIASGVAIEGAYTNVGSVDAVGPTTATFVADGVGGYLAADAAGETVHADDPSNYFGVTSGITVETTVQSVFDADAPAGAPLVSEGDALLVTYTVTNDGNTELADVVVGDDTLGTPVYVGGDTDGDGLLDQGETWVYTLTVTADTVGVTTAVGDVTAVAPATVDSAGNTVPGIVVTDTDPHSFEVPVLGVSLETYVAGTEDADTGMGPYVDQDGQVEVTYVVTNTGTEPLSGIVVVDDTLGTPVYVDGDTSGDGLLDPGETWTYTLLADPFVVAPGEQITALGTVTATGPATALSDGTLDGGLTPVQASDPHGWYTPVIGLRVETAVQGIYDADTPADGPLVAKGVDVVITYIVANTGRDPVGDVVVTDDTLGTPVYVAGDTDGDGLLDTDEVWTYELVVPADTSGLYSGVGTVTGNGPTIIDGQTGAVVPPLTTTDDDPHHYEVATGLAGTVWVDGDGDGSIDTGEPPIAGVTITLLDAAGNVVATTVTDANGDYLFVGLAAGDYTIVQTQPSGYGSTTPSTLEVTLTPAGLTGLDFGEDLGSVGDRVWDDADGDGVQDPSEVGIGGVTVRLLDESGTIIAETTTDDAGDYSFDGLLAGTYVVEFVPTLGFALTEPGRGDAATGSDPDWLTGRTAPVVLTAPGCDCPMQRTTDIDAGLVDPIIDLAIDGSVPSTRVKVGDSVVFSYTSTNNSNVPVEGARVVVTFPEGLLPTSVLAPGWTNVIEGRTVTLVLDRILFPGESLPPFSVTARVDKPLTTFDIAAGIATLDGAVETTLLNNNKQLRIALVSMPLPTTGSTTEPLVHLAVGMVLAGAVLLLGTRRRRLAR